MARGLQSAYAAMMFLAVLCTCHATQASYSQQFAFRMVYQVCLSRRRLGLFDPRVVVHLTIPAPCCLLVRSRRTSTFSLRLHVCGHWCSWYALLLLTRLHAYCSDCNASELSTWTCPSCAIPGFKVTTVASSEKWNIQVRPAP